MYLSPRRRREFGIVWTRGRDAKLNPCWRSTEALGLTIVRKVFRVGSVGSRWTYMWVVCQNGVQFASTSRLQRAFRIAANHVVLRQS